MLNDSAFVSPALKARVLEAIRDLDYAPSQLARNLRRGHSELIAIVVADLSNPFYSRVVCAAEAAVSAWGYSLVVFNSDEKPDAEKRILARVRALQCEGLLAGRRSVTPSPGFTANPASRSCRRCFSAARSRTNSSMQ